jgi:hypothetical protein
MPFLIPRDAGTPSRGFLPDDRRRPRLSSAGIEFDWPPLRMDRGRANVTHKNERPRANAFNTI